MSSDDQQPKHHQPEPLQPEFQGRKTKRADGRQRQLELLEATLRIIARDGIRSVKHRAIAKEAGVPLAATTYYFHDIESLICDAFLLFAAKNSLRNSWLEEQGNLLHKHEEFEKDPESYLIKLRPQIQTIMMNHIKRQVEDRDSRLIEHAFLNESLRNPLIASNFQRPQKNIHDSISLYLQKFNIKNPDYHAHAIYGLIQWLEYLLVIENSPANWTEAEQSITCLLEGILNTQQISKSTAE